MAERRARICARHPQGLEVEPLGACGACEGCAGACQLLGADRRMLLPLAQASISDGMTPGREVRLRIDAARLRALALASYGLLAAGLLAGALCGSALARLLSGPHDVIVALGAVAGTFLALRLTKARLRDVASHPPIQIIAE